jgi:hypothetical protein
VGLQAQELFQIGFVESKSDAGLFYLPSADGSGPPRLLLLVYVDDLLLAGPTEVVAAAKALLMAPFEARDLGEATFFLGMAIGRNRAARTITISQERHVTDLLAKYQMTEARPSAVPLAPGSVLTKEGESLDTDAYPYSSLVGSLLYLATCSRPDIAFAAGALAKFMAAPTKPMWRMALNVLRYLAATPGGGITFGGGKLALYGYCDSRLETATRAALPWQLGWCSTAA